MADGRATRLTFGLALVACLASTAPGNVLNPAYRPDLRELPLCSDQVSACFDFEDGDTWGWVSPEWFAEHDRLVDCAVELVRRPAEGHALRLAFDLPAVPWCATGIRFTGPADLGTYGHLSADIYLPQELPGRVLTARFILRAGDDWSWYQMEQKIRLVPGQWVTVTAPLRLDAETRDVWGPRTALLVTERSNVQEIMLRIEAAASGKPVAGRGEVLVDRVTLTP